MESNIFTRDLSRSEVLSNKLAADITYHSEYQSAIDVAENAYYMPSYHSVFDRDGYLIDSSTLERGGTGANHGGAWPPGIPKQIEIPTDTSVFDTPVIYLSVLFPHYGHFLLECISRLWSVATIGDRSVKFLYSESFRGTFWREGYVAELCYLLSLPFENFVFFDRPVKLHRVYIPHQTFSLPRKAYANHVNLPRVAAARVLDKLPHLSDQPLYLSRTRFVPEAHTLRNNRTLTNEAEFETILRKEGFRISYPEMLSLHEKIKLYNSHRFILSTRSTGLLTLLFSINSTEQENVAFFERGASHLLWSFLLVDALNGIGVSNYLELLNLDAGDVLKPEIGRTGLNDWRIEIPQALSWLTQRGLLRPQRERSHEAPHNLRAASSTKSEILEGNITVQFVRTEDGAHEDIIGRVDITYCGCLSAGRRQSGLQIGGICLTVDQIPNDQIEYQVLTDQGGVPQWVTGGVYCGARGSAPPVHGFAVRLLGNAALEFDLSYVGTFVSVQEPVWAAGGRICRAVSDAALEALQIFIRRKQPGFENMVVSASDESGSAC